MHGGKDITSELVGLINKIADFNQRNPEEEGYEVILCNSNPATIMTDTTIADKVYMEPLTLEYVAKIIRYERPDAIIPGLGGQTGLNLGMQLAKNVESFSNTIVEKCFLLMLNTDSLVRMQKY